MHMAIMTFEDDPAHRRQGSVAGRILTLGVFAAALASGALYAHAQIQANGQVTAHSLSEYARVAAKPADSWSSIDLHKDVVYFTGGPNATGHYRFLTEHAQELANSGIAIAFLQNMESGSTREQLLKELEESLRKVGIEVRRIPPVASREESNANVDLIVNTVVATRGKRILFVGSPYGDDFSQSDGITLFDQPNERDIVRDMN
jgi:hypothetical protein